MSQPVQNMDEVLTFSYLFKILSIPTFIGTVTGYFSANWRNKNNSETKFKEIFSNCGVSIVFCWMTMLAVYEWTAISAHMKMILCIAVGFTSTHWDRHFITIIHLIIERIVPMSKREKYALRKMQHEYDETEYRSPKRIPKEFLDDEDGGLSIDSDDTFCDYPPKKVTIPKKKTPSTKSKKITPTVKDTPVKDVTPKKKTTTKSKSKKDVSH